MNDLFEKATRLKLRFDTPKGFFNVEDLWDLPLTSRTSGLDLDTIAKQQALRLKQEGGVGSYVTKTTKANEILQLRFDIVKYIIDVRLEEADRAEKAKAAKQTKERILEIIASKKDDELRGKSVDELMALANSL